jgi:hypothetical protein
MQSVETWGPPTWIFLHTLAAKVNQGQYPKLKKIMFNIVSLICHNLPCPRCAREVGYYLLRIKPNKLETKQDFILFIYLLHNWVNKKKKKPLFDSTKLNNYNSFNIYSAFNNFIQVYQRKGNMQIIDESDPHNLTLNELNNWIHVYGKEFT